MSVRPYGGSPVLSAVPCAVPILTEAQKKRIQAMQTSLEGQIDADNLDLLISAIRDFLNVNFPDENQRASIEETYFKGRLTKN